MATPRYLTHLERVSGLGDEERARLEKVIKKFPFRANEYYLSLINWNDPADPIRKIIIPEEEELEEWGRLDPSLESDFTIAPGLQHKYDQTALLLVSDLCGGFCRFCFRKRLFIEKKREVIKEVSEELEYIAAHPEITNVLLTGGDPLILATSRLETIISKIREIDHVKIIRIGSKIPAYFPHRILNDPSLADLIRRYSTPDKRIYIMTQFNHPRELTNLAIQGIDTLMRAGALCANQTPLLRGINDSPDTLAELFRRLSFVGDPPYYVFQCRPTIGNRHFAVPVEESYVIFEQAKMQCSGLAKRARFVMSHATGKIEVIGIDDRNVYFKYHQAATFEDIGKVMSFSRNPDALWFDDYTHPIQETPVV
jgi:lysine 2,3-aminomutase